MAYPEPLPPLRKAEILRTDAGEAGSSYLCASCFEADGKLRCSSCKAVYYCSQKCQKRKWKFHKTNCMIIKEKHAFILDAGEKLMALKLDNDIVASIFEEEYGIEKFMKDHKEIIMEYFWARYDLCHAYGECGLMTRSHSAFLLAAHNILDLMVLAYRDVNLEKELKHFAAGLLIATNSDQCAYNFIRYFELRTQMSSALPYFCVDRNQDIQEELDFEKMCIEDLIGIVLLKYRRMVYFVPENLSSYKMMWDTFWMGTDSQLGADSHILKLKGVSPVVEKIKDYVYLWRQRCVIKLLSQVKNLMKLIENRNEVLFSCWADPLLLAQIMDSHDQTKISKVEEVMSLIKSYGDAAVASDGFMAVVREFVQTKDVKLPLKLEGKKQ